MKTRMRMLQLVQRVHFEDFGGAEFERLVFAYHVRAGWTDVEWYGQTGSDHGRDIVGYQPVVTGERLRAVVQCVNRGSFTQRKAEDDIQAALSSGSRIDAFKFVVRSSVSAKRRDAVKAFADRVGITHVTIWSGVEFEENLRLTGEDLLRRFCLGEAFPDKPEELRRFAEDFADIDDDEALSQMAAVFDRPAFRTRFHYESSLPSFLQAIEDTIAALNTGVWRTREGEDIRRIPSVHHIRDLNKRAHVSRAIQLVDRLRRTFVSGLRDQSILPCGCRDPNCPTFTVKSSAAIQLDEIRSEALRAFRNAFPRLRIELE